jgi:hypothetical protein
MVAACLVILHHASQCFVTDNCNTCQDSLVTACDSPDALWAVAGSKLGTLQGQLPACTSDSLQLSSISSARLGKDAQWITIEDTNHGSFIHPEAREWSSKEASVKSKHGQCIHTSPNIFDFKQQQFLPKGLGISPVGVYNPYRHGTRCLPYRSIIIILFTIVCRLA